MILIFTKYRFIFFSILVLTLISCSPILRYTSFDKSPRVPNNNPIDIFTTVNSIPYKYKELGLITIEGNADEEALINIAKNKASKIGATGVILISNQTINRGNFKNGSSFSSTNNQYISKFTAILRL